MKTLLLAATLSLIFISTRAQNLSSSDRLKFITSLNYLKSVNESTKISSYQLMRWTLMKVSKKEPQNSDIMAAFESFNNLQISDNFFYEAVISQHDNLENARLALYSYCKNMQLSIKIVSYVNYKFKRDITNYLAKLDQTRQELTCNTIALDKGFISTVEYEKLNIVEEKDLNILPVQANHDMLISGLDSLYLNTAGFDNDKPYVCISAKVRLIIDSNGEVVKIIDIIPLKSFDNAENVYSKVDLSFIKNLKFTPGQFNGNAVNTVFDLILDEYYSAKGGTVVIQKNGDVILNIFKSKNESWQFNVKKNEVFYQPLLQALKGKTGTCKIYYLERDQIADNDAQILTEEKMLLAGVQ